MPNYIVTRKSDGEEVYEYQADFPVEWDGMGFATHAHTELPDVPAADVVEMPVVRVFSQTEFMRRFTQDERMAIWAAAKVNAALEDFTILMKSADDIYNNDADVVAGLTMLEQAGLLAEGRAQEILNG